MDSRVKDRLRAFCQEPRNVSWTMRRRDHTHRLTCFELGNDGGFAVFGDESGGAFVQNLQTDELTRVSTRKEQKVSGVALNPSSEMVVVCGNTPTLSIASFRKEVCEVRQTFDEAIRCAVFVEDLARKQNLLLSGGVRCVFLSDCATGTQISHFDGHKGGVTTIRSWGGCMFLSTSLADRCVRLWDIRTPRAPVREFPTVSRQSPVNGIAISGGRFLARIDGSNILLHDILSGKQLATYTVPSGAPKTIQFFPDSLSLVVAKPKDISLMDLQYSKPPTQKIPIEGIDTPRFPRWSPSTGNLLFVDGASVCEASLDGADV